MADNSQPRLSDVSLINALIFEWTFHARVTARISKLTSRNVYHIIMKYQEVDKYFDAHATVVVSVLVVGVSVVESSSPFRRL